VAIEVKPFGIKVTIIEPGAYATEFGSQTSLKFAAGLDIYADLRTQTLERLKNTERGSEGHARGHFQSSGCGESAAKVLSRQLQFALGACSIC
jgi:NAD(P)-dependent dehydrogenase (short-subunit alcohol dehydrogenase family)